MKVDILHSLKKCNIPSQRNLYAGLGIVERLLDYFIKQGKYVKNIEELEKTGI